MTHNLQNSCITYLWPRAYSINEQSEFHHVIALQYYEKTFTIHPNLEIVRTCELIY
jgi:hypothetical protein